MIARASLCIALLAFAARCTSVPGSPDGGGTGGGGTGGGAVDPDAVCAAWADKVCTKIDACSSYMLRGNYGDLATCKARSKLGCVPWFGAPGSGVTADGTNRCAAAFAASSCDDVENNVFPLECRVFGDFANSAGCGDSAQCQSGHCSITSGLCGTCQARHTAGGSCAVNSDCERGLVCAGGLCFSPGDTGAACSPSEPCKNTHACVSGQCRRRITTAGTACDVQASNCDGFIGLWCNIDRAVCQQIALTGGSTCGYDGTTLTLCLRSADCSVPTGQNIGTCVSPSSDGQACTTAAPGAFSCFSPAECIGGVCTLPGPASCP